MKISTQWLNEWVQPQVSPAELAEQLTMAGLEVDSVTPAAPGFESVIVADVVSVSAHPNADRLAVCTVDTGTERVQVVCGAPNVRPGLRAPLAQVGAQLPGGQPVTASTIRGTTSAGMLCSGQELGLSDDADGLLELPDDAPTGVALETYLGLDDTLLEIELTPNRGDCLSIAGVAREVSVINACPLNPPVIPAIAAQIQDTFPVALAAPAACPIYAGRVIRGLDLHAATPLWLRERLRRAGSRSITPLVDVTNYVMLELGQPLHAFDLNKLTGGIEVRFANPGEQKLTLLDGQEVDIRPETLLITDASGPVALAGIMGGLSTAVDAQTVDVFLEGAFFSQAVMAGKARGYRLHTDASHRYERGVSPALPAQAIERATELILAICGGQPGPVVVTEQVDHVPAAATVQLRAERLEKVLGFKVADDEVTRMLRGLGMDVNVSGGSVDKWIVTPPPFRFDVSIEEDLIEEVARLYGYDRVQSTLPRAQLDMRPEPEMGNAAERLCALFVERGYFEAVTYAFVDDAFQRRFEPAQVALPLANPIASDMAVMRTSLWPGLIQALDHNLKRRHTRVRLFELGSVFLKDADRWVEQPRVGGILAGLKVPEQWGADKRPVDFFDAKSDVENVVALAYPNDLITFSAATHPALHPGQCAAICVGDRELGIFGALHPALVSELELSTDAFLFELYIDALSEGQIPRFTTLSRFPYARRDLSLLVDVGVAAADLLECAREAAGPLLRDLQLFDVYQGKGIDSRKKSVALGLIFQGTSSTLMDADVDMVISAVLSMLNQRLGATLRE